MARNINTFAKTIEINFNQSLDQQAVASMADQIAGTSAAGATVMIDMSRVSHLDGAGIGAVAYLYRRATASGRQVQVTGARGQPLAYIQDLGLARTLGLPRAVKVAANRGRQFGTVRAAA